MQTPPRRAQGFVDPSRSLGYPAPVAALIDELARLPGIGRRSAERLALHLLKAPAQTAQALAHAIGGVKASIRNCDVCANLTESKVCSICADAKRDPATVLVVEQPRDLLALESTGTYRGVYHVLLGCLAPMDGIGPESLTVAELLARITDAAQNAQGQAVAEVILGLNPTLEGDGTSLYLTAQMNAINPRIKITRLARGLPAGAPLQLAPKGVLADAISGRTVI